ncbi:MAG: cytochrome c [Bacteroidetes bacterium]|nr:cytochrome c [Bacteroidota bacterium]
MLKKPLIGVIIFAAFSIFLFTTCKQTKEPVVETCDNPLKTYNTHVKPIISAYCVVCHNPNGAYPSIPLTSYLEVKNAAQNGKLILSIKHENGAVAMPQGGAKLNDADISKIECWKTNGFPE